ncbi:MAG: VTT domain-containing protein, partial [Planctomycetota bacterium JB042]
MALGRGTVALLGVTLSLVTLLTVTFLAAEALGLTDESLFRDRLLSLADREHGPALAASTIAGLLAADLVLPVPSSVLMTLAGFLCGVMLGAAASFAGAMASAWIGFFACRRFGRGAFRRLVGERDVEPLRRFVDRYGAWAILLSRPVPMLTEVTSCVAGLAGMAPSRFSWLA